MWIRYERKTTEPRRDQRQSGLLWGGCKGPGSSCIERLLSARSIWLNGLRLRLRRSDIRSLVSYNLAQYGLLFSSTSFALCAREPNTEIVQNIKNNSAQEHAPYETQNENQYINQDMDHI